MLFPLEPGVGWHVCPLLSAGRPGAAPGCISASTSCSALLLSNFSPTKDARGFQVQLRGAEAAEGRSAEGAGVGRGWYWRVPRSQGLHNPPPTSLKECRV